MCAKLPAEDKIAASLNNLDEKTFSKDSIKSLIANVRNSQKNS